MQQVHENGEDLSEKVFRAYSDQDFKQCKETLETLRKQQEDLKQAGGDCKRLSLVKQNLILTGYYQAKGAQPHKLLSDLQLLSQQIQPQIQVLPANHHLNNIKPQDQEINTVLMYNCAVMAYQTQQLGLSLGHLTVIFQYLDQFELFLQIKSLFLLLQVLYELRQVEPAQPILQLLEAKFMDLRAITAQKQQIKDFQSEISTFPDVGGAKEEESKNNSEVFDESIVSKNSFCILMGSYLRRHAVSPKNINLHEFKFLFHTYSALFKILQKDLAGASENLQKAHEQRSGIPQDPVQYNPTDLQKVAGQQQMGLLRHAKAMLEHARNNDFKTVQSLYVSEKEVGNAVGPHRSCYHQKKNDSHHDQVYQKCKQMHPQMYFNNIGLLHLRFQKYRMATFYFSKAFKFIETSQVASAPLTNTSNSETKTGTQPWSENFAQNMQSGTSTHEHVSNLNSQRTVEILFNMGISLYKDGNTTEKLEQAFRCFEKVSNALKGNPKLWYYMALTIIKIHTQIKQAVALEEQQSDAFESKYGYQQQNITFKKVDGDQNLKRLQLAPKASRISAIHQMVVDRESDYLDKLKQTQNEITKNRHKQNSNMSKAQLKKQEKAQQQAWQNTNAPKDSMQLQNAVQYLQNALVAIRNEVKNSQNYTLLFRMLHNAQIQKMQTLYDEQHAKVSLDHLSENEVNRRQAESGEVKNDFGEDGWLYPQLDCPSNQNSIQDYNQQQRQTIDKKYQTLVKNVHFYLCFVNLELSDYAACIRHGNELLKQFAGKLTPKTEHTLKQYLAEAYCIVGQPKEAQRLLQETREKQVSSEILVSSTSLQLILPEKISTLSVTLINQVAVKLCENDILGAKDQIDEIITSLDLKIVNPQSSSESLIPQYLIHTLVYFFLKTRNFQMARQLTKHRRFINETNFGEASTKGSKAAPPQLSCAVQSFT